MNNQQKIDDFFKQFNQKIESIKQRIPDIIGTEVVNSSIDNFVSESYFGTKWKARLNTKNRKKLLVKDGFLDGSVRIVRTGLNSVTVGTDITYAAIHNYGGTIARKARQAVVTHKKYNKGINKGKTLFAKNNTDATFSQKAIVSAYSINMPKRQFLGGHPKLIAKIYKTVEDKFKEEFK